MVIDGSMFLKLFAVGLGLFLVLDLLWRQWLARDFYQTRLAGLAGSHRLLAAAVFYSLYALGLTYFALYPTALRGTLYTGLVLGGLYGCFTFIACSAGNVARIHRWPVSVAVTDVVWNTMATAGASAAVYYLYANYLAL